MMKKIHFLALLLFPFVFSSLEGQRDAYWPPIIHLPKQQQTQVQEKKEEGNQRVLIKQLKSIYIVEDITSLRLHASKEKGVFVYGVHLPGNKEDFHALLWPYIGKSLTSEDLLTIKRLVILYYRDHEHPLVTVRIPEQEITHGVLTLIVQESHLGQIKVCGDRFFPKKRYEEAIQIKKGNRINEKILLKNLDFLNRNPFRRVDLIYTQGEEKNTTDIELVVKDVHPMNVYLGADNTGLVHTDRTRWFIGGTWADAFDFDQILSLQFTSAPNTNKFHSVTGSWTIPLPIQHILLFYGGYSHVNAHVQHSCKTHGTSGQLSTRYTLPLPSLAFLLHEFSVGFDFKRSNNTLEFVESDPVIGQEVNLTQFVLSYNLGFERDHSALSHKLGFDAQLFFSPFSWIPNQSRKDFRSLNLFADPVYLYARTSLNYKLRFASRAFISLIAAGQLTNQTLLPSEQFGLGGYGTVRGYEERQLNADDGVLLSLELHAPRIRLTTGRWRKIKDGLEFLAFFDYGYAHDRHQTSGEKKNNYLMGIGPGIRYAIENYFSARLDLGVKLHQEQFPGGSAMLHFSLMGSF